MPAAFRYRLAVSRRTPVASSIWRRLHPNRPSARICCCFSRSKTFAMASEANRLAPLNVLNDSLPYRWDEKASLLQRSTVRSAMQTRARGPTGGWHGQGYHGRAGNHDRDGRQRSFHRGLRARRTRRVGRELADADEAGGAPERPIALPRCSGGARGGVPFAVDQPATQSRRLRGDRGQSAAGPAHRGERQEERSFRRGAAGAARAARSELALAHRASRRAGAARRPSGAAERATSTATKPSAIIPPFSADG